MTPIEVFFLPPGEGDHPRREGLQVGLPQSGSKWGACEEKQSVLRETQRAFSLLRPLHPVPIPAIPVLPFQYSQQPKKWETLLASFQR